MSAQHTPGLLTVGKRKQACHSKHGTQDGYVIEGLEMVPDYECPLHTESNARRIVACWNALEGVPTEDIEKVLIHGTALKEMAAQHAELLAAAKLVLAWYEAEKNHGDTDFYQRLQMCRDSEDAIRAAIAKATGSAS